MISRSNRRLICVAIVFVFSGCPSAKETTTSQNSTSPVSESEPSVPETESDDPSHDSEPVSSEQGTLADESTTVDSSEESSVDHRDPQAVANAFLHAVRTDDRDAMLQLWLPSERDSMRAMLESAEGRREFAALQESVSGDVNELAIDLVGHRARANFDGGSFDMEQADDAWYMSSGGAIERENDPEDRSRRNINQLMLGIILFAEENDKWPDSIADIRTVLAERDQDLDGLLNNPWTGDNPGYEYVKPTTPYDDTPSTTIVIYQLRNGKRAPREKVGYRNSSSRYPEQRTMTLLFRSQLQSTT